MKIAISNQSFPFITDYSKDSQDGAFLITQSSKRYLQEAKAKFKHFLYPCDLPKFLCLSPKIIGITGTNGKTTTAAMIAHVLMDFGYQVGLLGTRGFFINHTQKQKRGLTTPALLEIYASIHQAALEGCEFFVMEVSSHAIAQARIEGLEFDLKILTNITSDHLDYHHTLQEYQRIKNSFLSDEGKKIINADEKQARYHPQNVTTYALNTPSDYLASYELKPHIKAKIQCKSQSATFEHPALFGKHNLSNLLASIAALQVLTQAPLERITKSLERFEIVPGRLQLISQNPCILVDFAHSVDGMKQVFEAFSGKQIIVVFGAGGDRDKTKRPLMGLCAALFAHKIYITSDNPRSEDPNAIIEEIYHGIPPSLQTKTIIKEPNRQAAIKAAMQAQEAHEVLLILGKGDEPYQILHDKTIEFDDAKEVQKLLNKHKNFPKP